MATKPQPMNTERVQAMADQLHGDTTGQAAHVDEQPATPMSDHAVAIAGTANTEAITQLIQAIGSEMDTTKAKLATALINVTHTAVQLQGRTAWNTRDFLSFGVALAALSHIDAD